MDRLPGRTAREDLIDFSLRDLAAPLFRRKRVLLGTFLAAFALIVLFGFLRPAPYTSQMAILVSRERLDPLVTSEVSPQMLNVSSPLSEEEINSEAELLKSRDVLEQVVLANGLEKSTLSFVGSLFHRSENRPDAVARAVRELAKDIKVEPTVKTNLIRVSYSSRDPQLSYGVLKALGDFYVRKHIEVYQRRGSYEFFARETQNYKTALEDTETRLSALRQSQQVSDPDEERADLARELTSAIGQLHATERTIAAEQQRMKRDEEQMKVTPQRSATKQDVQAASLLLQNLGSTLLAAENKRTQLKLKYDPTYPLVIEADQEVDEAKAAIAKAQTDPYVNQTTDRDPVFELLREDLVRNQTDLAGQQGSLSASRQGIANMQSQMVKLAAQSLEQADLQREAKADEQSYLLYLSKREQERTSSALDNTRIANVGIAVPPAIPVLPAYSFPFIAVIAVAVATSLSLVMAYTAEYFDKTFHTPMQVTELLGIATVIAIPESTAWLQ